MLTAGKSVIQKTGMATERFQDMKAAALTCAARTSVARGAVRGDIDQLVQVAAMVQKDVEPTAAIMKGMPAKAVRIIGRNATALKVAAPEEDRRCTAVIAVRIPRPPTMPIIPPQVITVAKAGRPTVATAVLRATLHGTITDPALAGRARGMQVGAATSPPVMDAVQVADILPTMDQPVARGRAKRTMSTRGKRRRTMAMSIGWNKKAGMVSIATSIATCPADRTKLIVPEATTVRAVNTAARSMVRVAATTVAATLAKMTERLSPKVTRVNAAELRRRPIATVNRA